MNNRYVVITADSHAGLPCADYRPYLESKYHAAFDDYLAQQHAKRDEALQMNYDYIMGWETDNAEGLRGAYDVEQRDKELDADGVSAEVMFQARGLCSAGLAVFSSAKPGRASRASRDNPAPAIR